MNLNTIKSVACLFFFIVGLAGSYLTYGLLNQNSFGKIETYYSGGTFNNDRVAAAGSGVDSSNDGIAAGLGIISGFSFLSSTLLLNSISPKKPKN